MLPKWPVAEDRMKMSNEQTCHRGRSGTIRSPAVPMAFLSLSYKHIAPIAPSLVILSDSIDVTGALSDRMGKSPPMRVAAKRRKTHHRRHG